MLEIVKHKHFFKRKEIWFGDRPFDVDGVDEVVFRSCKENIQLDGFQTEVFTTMVIDLNNDVEYIWQNMDFSMQKAIKRAIREGITVRLNEDHENFYRLNCLFRQQKGEAITVADVEFMKKYGPLFTAYFENRLLAGQFYLEDAENIRGLASASLRLQADEDIAGLVGRANRLLYWEAIKYAKQKGIKVFDMGGYYTGEKKDEQKEGINQFKKKFGGQIVTHYIHQKYYSVWYSLMKKIYVYFKRIKS